MSPLNLVQIYQVSEIPKTFSSVSDYINSFNYPLFEETHEDLRSKILGVNRSPMIEISGFVPDEHLLYTVYYERRQGSYEPVVGDLIALTDVRPKCVDDLKRPNMYYLVAIVDHMKVKSSSCKLRILSSKPITGNDCRHFIVYLTNLTTNERISRSLYSPEGEKKKMFETLLRVDSSVEESCVECSLDETSDLFSLNMKEVLKRFQLDCSQEAAVLSCAASRYCDHKNTIKLIWAPPGTGKTKTISSLLFMLLRMTCRTLTCAPTNIAVLGVTKKVLSLVRDSLVYDTYGLGDIVLFGNYVARELHLCGRTRLGYLSGTETPSVLVGDVS
ncbi:putative P-loop containing nucleoside triphosphate hydrolase, DNA2/NAM7 helicase, helicase [Helianthus anomalus]